MPVGFVHQITSPDSAHSTGVVNSESLNFWDLIPLPFWCAVREDQQDLDEHHGWAYYL